MDIKEMSIRELFDDLAVREQVVRDAKKGITAAQEVFQRAQRDLAEIVRPDKIELASERWLGKEKDAITAAIGVFEAAQMAYNQVGREIDIRKMEIDEEKIRLAI